MGPSRIYDSNRKGKRLYVHSTHSRLFFGSKKDTYDIQTVYKLLLGSTKTHYEHVKHILSKYMYSLVRETNCKNPNFLISNVNILPNIALFSYKTIVVNMQALVFQVERKYIFLSKEIKKFCFTLVRFNIKKFEIYHFKRQRFQLKNYAKLAKITIFQNKF